MTSGIAVSQHHPPAIAILLNSVSCALKAPVATEALECMRSACDLVRQKSPDALVLLHYGFYMKVTDPRFREAFDGTSLKRSL